MVDITLDPNKEEEQENVATPASVPVAPVVQPVDETPEPPAQEEVPEPDIVVRPQLNTDEGRAKGLAPDPYMQSSGPAAQELFRYRPQVGVFTKEGVPGEDTVTDRQDRILSTAKIFYTLPGEDGKVKRLGFAVGDDMQTKYRKLLRNEGGFLQDIDEEGNEISLENGQPKLVPLTTTQEYMRYTQGSPETVTGQVAQTVAQVFTGPTGAGDLKDIDEKLKELGMTNQIARTAALRGIATGRYSGEGVARDLRDIGVMAASIPALGVDAVQWISAEVTNFAMKEWLDYSAEDAQKQEDSIKSSGGFKSVRDFVNLKDHLELQYFTEEKAGGTYSPEVIEEVFGSRGLYNTAVRHAQTEGALYAVWGAYRVYGAAKRMKGFRSDLEKKYETSDLAEAFQKAKEQDNLSPRQVVDSYIQDNFSNKVAEKVKRDLDLGVGMSIRKPGPERQVILRDQVNQIEEQIGKRREVYWAAVNQGKKDFADREYKAIERLFKERQAVMFRETSPKYMRDLVSEAGITVGAMTAANELSVQMFSTQEDVWMAEGVAAVMASTNLGRLDIRENTLGLARFSGVVLKELTEAAQQIKAGNLSFSDYRAELKKRNLSRRASKLLDNVGQYSSEYADMFMQGIMASADRRSELLVLSEDYGVDIDVDLFSSNLATMSGIGALMDVASQLDQRMTVTGIKDVAEPIVARQQNIYDQTKLVSQLATATRKLLDLKLTANLPDDHAVSLMADGMRNFVGTQMARLDGDKRYIDELITKNRERLEFALRTDTLTATDKGLEVTTLLDDTYRIETEAAISSISNASELGVDATQEMLQESLNRLDKLRQDNLAMLERMKNGLRTGEAQTSESAAVFAHGVTIHRGNIDSQVAEMYAKFDSDHGDVASNMVSFFDDVVLGGGDATFIAEKEMTKEAAKFLGFDMIPSQRKGLAAYFNGAAQRSLTDIIDTQLGGTLTQVTDDLEISDMPPLRKWMEIRRIAKEEPDRIGLSAEQGLKFAEDMPLLVSPADWRAINKVIGKTLRKSSDDRQQAYFGIYDQWQLVGDPDSSLAFKRGWSGGNPANMAKEVYDQFREAQDFYRTEVVNRYNGSAWTRKINDSLDQDIKEGAKERGIEGMLQEMEDVPDEMQPYVWLSSLTKHVLEKNKGRTLDGLTRTLALHTEFYSAFSRLGGAYDPKTKQYYILSESDLPEDKDTIAAGSAMVTALQRNLQGVLAANNPNVLPVKSGTNKVVFDPFVDIKYDKEAFQSFFNIPKYRRNADGSISPVMTADGQPEMLLSEDQVWEAISLNALEQNRGDLQKVFDEAEKVVNNLEADLKGQYGSYEEMIKQSRQDIEFAKSVYREISGGDAEQAYRAGGELPVRNVDVDVAAKIYATVVEGNSLDLDRVRGILAKEGYDKEYIDESLKKLVNQHLVASTNKHVGKYTEKVDGQMLERPVLELDAQKIVEVLGEPGSTKRARLEAILGDRTVATWELIGDAINQIDPKVNKSGITARVSSISLDSVLSRIYNINRGVVSPQWVATESIIRASRQHGGKLLTAMLTDEALAREVLNIVQTGVVPQYKVQPDWLRALTVQVMQAEAKNEAYWEADRMRGVMPEGVSPGIPDRGPNVLQQAIATMESPEKLRAIADRERVTPEAVKKQIEDDLTLEMKSYGFDSKYLQNLTGESP